MIKIISWEIKHQFKSVLFYICVAAILVMAIVQFIPKDWRSLAEPMRSSNFIYFQLEKDVQRGMSDNAFISYNDCNKLVFSQEQVDFMKQIIEKMNPTGIRDRGTLVQMCWAVSERELEDMLNELSLLIGKENYYSNGADLLLLGYLGGKEIEDKQVLMERIGYKIHNCLLYGYYTRLNSWFFSKTIYLTVEESRLLEKYQEELNEIRSAEGNVDEKYSLYMKKLYQLDHELGGSTEFAPDNLNGSFRTRFTYEEMLEHYNSLFAHESRGYAYARYCSDYLGLVFGILPPFIAVFAIRRERRYKIGEVLYPRVITSGAFIGGRVLGLIFSFLSALFLVTAGTGVYLSVLMYDVSFLGGFLVYAAIWTAPTILISITFPSLLALLLDNEIVPLAVWTILCFYSMMPLIGEYKIWKPVIRFNSVGNYGIFQENMVPIISNRLVMVVMSIICTWVLVLIYERKRRNLIGRSSLLHQADVEK